MAKRAVKKFFLTLQEANGDKFETCIKININNSFDIARNRLKNNCILLIIIKIISANYVSGTVLDSLYTAPLTITASLRRCYY